MVGLRLLHDWLAVERLDPVEQIGSILLPDQSKEPPQRGIVRGVGPGGFDDMGAMIPMDVQVGDQVMFGKFSGTPIELDGKALLLMREPEVLGVLR